MRLDEYRHTDSWSMVRFFIDAKGVRRRGRTSKRSDVLDDLITRTMHAQLMDLLRDDRDDDDIDFDDL